MRIQQLFLLIISLVTAACGYHLRGAYDLPKEMKSIYLDGGSPLLKDQLATVLKTSSGKLAATPENADAVIKIFDENIVRRVLSLSSRGRSNDIELAGHLEFQLLTAKHGMLIEREPVDFRREYFNDQQDVIAKGNEETVIKKEMYQQVVRTIMSRSRAALDTKGK